MTIKVVYNSCYGGFSLSKEAIIKLAELKKFNLDSADEYKCYKFIDNLDRWDPDLVSVVETLGEAANGSSAKLKIKKINLNDLIQIKDYDGWETVMIGNREA